MAASKDFPLFHCMNISVCVFFLFILLSQLMVLMCLLET